MTNQVDLPKPDSLRPFWLLVILVLAVLFAYGLAVFSLIGNWAQRGQFGDMFGATNTLFSGLAFAALTYTLFLQRKELSLQRLELGLTRAELSKQSIAQSQQATTALRAAKINALGSLLQTYAQFASSNHHSFITEAGNWPVEVRRVRDELHKLLQDPAL